LTERKQYAEAQDKQGRQEARQGDQERQGSPEPRRERPPPLEEELEAAPPPSQEARRLQERRRAAEADARARVIRQLLLKRLKHRPRAGRLKGEQHESQGRTRAA